MKIKRIEPIKLILNPFQKHIVEAKKLLKFTPKKEDNIFAKADEILKQAKDKPTFKRIYVAGAMSGDNILTILNNISDGIHKGAELLELGYAPFVPHTDVLFKFVKGDDYKVPMEYYYNYTIEYLKVADAVLVCDNYKNSKGTREEIELAERAGIPVFYNIRQLDNYFRGTLDVSFI